MHTLKIFIYQQIFSVNFKNSVITFRKGENMNYLLNAPFILDFIATATLFALCFFIVVGAKVFLSSIESISTKPKPIAQNATSTTPKQPEKHKTVRRLPKKPIRSIEINPDEVDRIYVKKIS